MHLTSTDTGTLLGIAVGAIILIVVGVSIAVYLVTRRHRRGLRDGPVIFDLKDDSRDE